LKLEVTHTYIPADELDVARWIDVDHVIIMDVKNFMIAASAMTR
jgi:hypothetical protein